MKKFIQIFAIFSLLFVFSAVAAFAQSERKYQAQIPFDFNIGQNSYPAGSYFIKISRNNGSGLILVLEDGQGKRLDTVFVSDKGQTFAGNSKIVFNRYGNQRFLTELQTAEYTISLGVSKSEKLLADKLKAEDSVNILPDK